MNYMAVKEWLSLEKGFFMDKKQLRAQVKQRLVDIDLQSLAVKSKKACQHVINTRQYKEASVVMLFLSLPYEIETAPIILDAW